MIGVERFRVSLIFTVLNEAATIDDLLDSIAVQSRQPDEIIVVDGGSTDGTVERLRTRAKDLGLIVLDGTGTTISQGRNIALRAARGDILAVTDAGVRLESHWLERLVGVLEGRPETDVASGFFQTLPQSTFELALGVTTLPDVGEIDPARFLPSSRSVALRRSWIDAGIQYPGWLDYCEDLVFDLRLHRAGARFAFVEDALALYRPRPSLMAHWWQYRNYARGDGKSGLFLRRHIIRYGSYAALAMLIACRRRSTLALVSFGASMYLRKPWLRLWMRREQTNRAELLGAWLLIPYIRLAGDLAKMSGYPAGLFWRARRYGLRRTWKTIPDNTP